MPTLGSSCARELLETVPLVMRVVRSEMRSHRGGELSVSQFRTMLFIGRTPGCSLSQVASFLDLTLASTSKMVDGLVGGAFIERVVCASDRRRIRLTLTGAGQELLAAADAATQARLGDVLAELTEEEQTNVLSALQALRRVFSPFEAAET